jgi:HPt (histidine-containing phosphotransfer) domain-containing protein
MNTTIQSTLSTEKLFDLTFLQTLSRGNAATLQRMISSFVHNIPVAVEEIKEAYRRKDFSTLRETAHRIKPVLGFYAIVKMEKDMVLIEKLAKEQAATPELELKIEKLDIVVNSVVENLKKDYSIQ